MLVLPSSKTLLPSCSLVSVRARSVQTDNSFAAFPFPFVRPAMSFDNICPSDVDNLQLVTKVLSDPEMLVFPAIVDEWVVGSLGGAVGPEFETGKLAVNRQPGSRQRRLMEPSKSVNRNTKKTTQKIRK